MKKSLIFLLTALVFAPGFSQSSLHDTIKKNFNSPDAEVKIKAYMSAYHATKAQNLEQALNYWQQAVNTAKQNKKTKQLADAYRRRVIDYYSQSDFANALRYIDTVFLIGKQAADSAIMGKAQDNMGSIYFVKKDYNKSLKHYFEGLKYYGNKPNPGVPGIYVNVGILYHRIENTEYAIKYLNMAVKEAEKYNDTITTVKAYNNLGNIKREENKFEQARDYYKKGMVLAHAKNLIEDLSDLHHNMGITYKVERNFDQALKHVLIALDYTISLERDFALCDSYSTIADIYREKGELKQAEKYYSMAETKALQYEFYDLLVSIYRNWAELCKQTGNTEKRMQLLEKLINASDSVAVRYNRETLQTMQLDFNISMKEKEDSIKRTEQARIYQLEINQQNQQIKNQRIFLAGGILVALLAIAIAFISFRAYKTKQLANEEIQKQKTIIETKNKEITDSINYAKRLQDAIIPSDEFIAKCFPQHFVLYKPKDIVSGDYYWAAEVADCCIIAAIDCTGHGVPGAFLSIIANNALNKIVNERREIQPSAILYQLHDEVKTTLAKDSKVNDGMDISLCSFNKKTNKLVFAGARNPLYHVCNGNMIEYGATKRSVGETIEAHVVPFTNTEIHLNNGDSFYLFTDGFADQFGGPKGKKYKYKQLKETLSRLAQKEMSQQKAELHTEFENWKANMEQVDDVLVIGVRV